MRKKNVKNKVLTIIACFCILLLGVGIAGAITQGFTNANPYGWFKSATADSNTNKTNPEKEQEHNVDLVPVLKYGLDIHDGDEITGFGFRQVASPDFSGAVLNNYIPDEVSNVFGGMSLGDDDVVGEILFLSTMDGGFPFMVILQKGDVESIFGSTIYDYVYVDGDVYFISLYVAFVPVPIYCNAFTSNTYFDVDGMTYMNELRFTDDGWLIMDSFQENLSAYNGYFPFGLFRQNQIVSYEEISTNVHVYNSELVEQLMFTLSPETYGDYYVNLVNSNSNDEPIENNSIQLSPFISNETHLEIGDHIYFNTSKGSELASYISNLEYDDSGAYILFTTDRMNMFISAMDLSKFGETGYALLFNNGQDNTKIIYATASGELNGMSWNSGWNNLDSNNGIEITYGSSGHSIRTINDTDPATWNGIIIGLLAQE